MFKDSRSFIVALTLTELILLLFFVLLFTTDKEIDDLVEERNELIQLRDSIAIQLEAMQAAISMDSSTLAALKESMPLRERVEELEEELAESEERAKALKSMIPEEGEDFDELIREAVANTAAQERADRLRERNEDLDLELERMTSQLANCQAQNINCANRLEQQGLGFPPCWADANGRPEYIFVTTLLPDSIVVDRVWPAHRDAEARAIPGVLELTDKTHSKISFARYAFPILNWSKDQQPECRHFVIVDDSPETSKEDYKDQLAQVENFFYKLLRR